MTDTDGVHRGSVQGVDAFIIDTPQSTAAISVFGGQTISFVPTGGGPDLLWLSPRLADPPTPLRGGIPLCWPYFGKEGQTGDVPSHGYARTTHWDLASARTTSSGEVEVTLQPEGLDHLDVSVRMTVRVGTTLELTVETRNHRSASFPLTEAFHNYFRVSDVADVTVRGVAGLTYIDKFDDLTSHVQQGDWRLPADVPRSDRIYPGAGGRYRLIDPGLQRVIEVTGRSARTAVIWNPGARVAATMDDVGPHWPEFVCVESANAGPDVVEVGPGATHTMSQTISVSPLQGEAR